MTLFYLLLGSSPSLLASFRTHTLILPPQLDLNVGLMLWLLDAIFIVCFISKRSLATLDIHLG